MYMTPYVAGVRDTLCSHGLCPSGDAVPESTAPLERHKCHISHDVISIYNPEPFIVINFVIVVRNNIN